MRNETCWRRALAWSLLLHLALLAGTGLLAPLAAEVRQPEAEMVEMDLTAAAPELDNRDSEQPAGDIQARPQPEESIPAAAPAGGDATAQAAGNAAGVGPTSAPTAAGSAATAAKNKIGQAAPPRNRIRYDPPLPKKNNVLPAYPDVALKHGWGGGVLIGVKVIADGTVGDIHVIIGSGHEALDDAAMQAVSEWRFFPGRDIVTGQPVDLWYNISVTFDKKTGKVSSE